MANPPRPLSLNAPSFVPGVPPRSPATVDRRRHSLELLIRDIIIPERRENALRELAKRRDQFLEMAPLLWYSIGTVAALIQEILSIYSVLSPPNLSTAQSKRVCNVLALLQSVASHPNTRVHFLNAYMPTYLYPFLNSTCTSVSFEYLRLTSLGVIGALVKTSSTPPLPHGTPSIPNHQVADTDVIIFLVTSEIVPLCLRSMEVGSELSKTVATFIVQRILLDNFGFDYMFFTADRFYALGRVLGNMVNELAVKPSARLLKYIIRCYLRLSDHPRARIALRTSLPGVLRDQTFAFLLRNEQTTRTWLAQLLHNIGGP